jgi:Ferredoxin-like domain in Api92-like protein
MSDAVFAKLVITGPMEAVEACRIAHFAGGSFDFNSVIPMPPELDLEESSAVTTGYDALYGDWTEPAQYWTWKESAASLGYPFPLASREQLLACIRSLDCADMYLVPAHQYKQNLEKYGHGTWYGWCKEHWGTKWNAEDASVAASPDRLVIRFTTPNSFPKPVAVALSKKWEELEVQVLYVDEHLRWARDYRLRKGREVQKMKRSPSEIFAEVRSEGAAA